jgi:hypothetical protein
MLRPAQVVVLAFFSTSGQVSGRNGHFIIPLPSAGNVTRVSHLSFYAPATGPGPGFPGFQDSLHPWVRCAS